MVTSAATLRYLVTPRLLRRSLLIAVVVGGTLFVVNGGLAALQAGLSGARLVTRLGLTLLIPFLTSLVAAALTRWELRPGEAAPGSALHVCLECASLEGGQAVSVAAGQPLPPCPNCGQGGRWGPRPERG